MEHAGESKMVIAMFVNKIRCCSECSFKIYASCRVVFIVFRVVDDARLELCHIAAALLVVADDAALAIHLVKRHLVVVLFDIQAFKVVVVISQTDSVIQVFDVANLLLHANDGTELSTVHRVEARSNIAGEVDDHVAGDFAFDNCQIFHKRRGIAVESEKVEFFINEIAKIGEEFAFRNDIIPIGIRTEDARTLGVS